MAERAEYDAIGDRYSEAKTAPWRIHLEAYTVEKLAGDVHGARVLDLACGDGFYSRRLAKLGAAEVIGVDASSEMIALGRQAEDAAPLGCRYRVAEVQALEVIGEFDVIVAAYLLNYARTRQELGRFCEVMCANLPPGGRVIGVNDYTDDGRSDARDFQRHGFRKLGPAPYSEGEPITYEFLLPEGRSFAITNYYWHPQTYRQALQAAGFRHPTWHPLGVSPAAGSVFAPDHWDDLLGAPPIAAFAAQG